jgi:hypothetical protein
MGARKPSVVRYCPRGRCRSEDDRVRWIRPGSVLGSERPIGSWTVSTYSAACRTFGRSWPCCRADSVGTARNETVSPPPRARRESRRPCLAGGLVRMVRPNDWNPVVLDRLGYRVALVYRCARWTVITRVVEGHYLGPVRLSGHWNHPPEHAQQRRHPGIRRRTRHPDAPRRLSNSISEKFRKMRR